MKLSDKVLRVLKGERIPVPKFLSMVRQAALFNKEGFNRRFFDWLLLVDGDSVLDMRKINLMEIGKGNSKCSEEHDSCEGKGCKSCGWSGQIIRWISDSTSIRLNKKDNYPFNSV